MSELADNWVKYLRAKNRPPPRQCTDCSCDLATDIAWPAFLEHYSGHDVQYAEDFDTQEAGPELPPIESNPEAGQSAAGTDARRGNKKLRSPSRDSPHQPQRSRARPTTVDEDFKRGHSTTGGRLWDPNDHTPSKSSGQSTPAASRQPTSAPHSRDAPGDAASVSAMVREPQTRPITHQQLVPEVKGIYAGLVMVESKCIEVDNAQSANKADHQLSFEQWQALIALHRTLLHEHHDFFLASQHPSASSALRRLASKYAMPARMWRHGIHSFLELLRHKLPESLEHMLSFIYLAYSIMALLYETVPAFEDTWIECLGDLGRYRMAIEDDDIRDREVWTGVSRSWYTKASEKQPTTGRLYHHLAILSRPNALQQLYFYCKALTVPSPFPSARESIMTLFEPLLSSSATRLQPIDAAYVLVHAILISGRSRDRLDSAMEEFYALLDPHIGRTTKKWLESGYYMAISLGCLQLEYGSESNVLMKAMSLRLEEGDVAMKEDATSESDEEKTFREAQIFANHTYSIIIRRWGDMNTLPFLHATLAFMHHMTAFPAAMAYLEADFHWKLTAVMLNFLKKSCKFQPRMDGTEFPGPKNELPRPLPEDYAMRGLVYTQEYFPANWFDNDKIEEDERYFELPSMVDERQERILWLGRQIARPGKWLTWDAESGEFGVNSDYDVELEEAPPLPSSRIA
ncbi:hypothetical protein B0I35DRAFT_451624 [Stachybotrys elegans]|uniref:DNA/RNA-binding domain-containing protein n=1 Tax=Stachybotrys elegans TaxID=80388 RepID=A0A8K0WR11_9HYPO|nr:hypothetical protein B0I35DRAFT_451624 [Stachybotrys elegans]